MILVTALVTVGAIAAYVVAAVLRREDVTGLGRTAYLASTAAVVAISCYFMWLILANHYEVDYVFRNSSKDLPLLYKISVFWAGQQGSFLFWALVSGLLGIWVMLKSREYESWMMAFWSCGQLLFLVLLRIDSPFRALPAQMLSQVSDGQGLRELLQNPWMAIHPPLVFIGYAAMCVPAAFAIAGLISGDLKSWCKTTLPWAIFGWITLGAGIILGAYWAYEVLGWGGYWGWDPVENASLIPWLTGTAMLHGMLAERYRGAFKRTNVALALVTFLFVFYATYLTRSNALAGFSVHTFEDKHIGTPLLWFMGGFALFSLMLSLVRWRKLENTPSFTSIASKDYLFFLAILMFVLCAGFVLVGTSLPVFTKIVSEVLAQVFGFIQECVPKYQSIAMPGRAFLEQTGVKPEFYNKVGTPIALIVFALMALAPILPWRRASSLKESTQGLGVIIAAVLIGIPFLGPRLHLTDLTAGIVMGAVGVVSLVGLIVNLWMLQKTSRSGLRLIGSYLAHVGTGMMFVGVIASAFGGPSKAIVLKKGQKPVDAYGYRFAYGGAKQLSGVKSELVVKVERDGRTIEAKPTLQLTRDQQMMASPAIMKSFRRDLYIAPKSVPGDEQKQLTKGKSVPVQDFEVTFRKFVVPGGHGSGGVRVGALLDVTANGRTEAVTPFLTVQSGSTAVPGTGARIAIKHINVEDKSIDVVVTTDAGEKSATIKKGVGTQVGNYSLTFREWFFPTGSRAEHMQVGAVIDVSSGGKSVTVKPIYQPGGGDMIVSDPVKVPGADSTVALTSIDAGSGSAMLTFTPTVEYAVVDVSVKPFISLLWIGSFLALVGGGIAMWRRSVESGEKVVVEG